MEKDFAQLVFDIVRMIPKGRVTTYGAIAQCIGMRRSSRMVGMALKYSSNENVPVPAHRVVNRNGILTGKNAFKKEYVMENLLKEEGVEVLDDKVVHFKTLFWDPYLEIKIE